MDAYAKHEIAYNLVNPKVRGHNTQLARSRRAAGRHIFKLREKGEMNWTTGQVQRFEGMVDRFDTDTVWANDQRRQGKDRKY